MKHKHQDRNGLLESEPPVLDRDYDDVLEDQTDAEVVSEYSKKAEREE